MRKDVKLGLAVGAVFLAVVIVWAAVPRHSSKTGVALNKTQANQSAPSAPTSTDVPPNSPQGQPSEPQQPATPTPAPTPTPTPVPDGNVVAGGSDSTKPPTDAHAAPDWAALLRASDDQLPALIGQTHTAAGTTQTPDRAPSSSELPPDDMTPATPHGGMGADTGLAPTTQQSSTSARIHTVAAGETLASIAKSVYGRSGMYLAIEKANPSINPSRLKVGTVLNLPASTSPSSAADAGTSSDAVVPARHHAHSEATIDSSKEYRVQPGDSLHKISVKLYGNASRADEIYTTNKDTIGDDPAKLKVGEVLKLPEPPTATR